MWKFEEMISTRIDSRASVATCNTDASRGRCFVYGGLYRRLQTRLIYRQGRYFDCFVRLATVRPSASNVSVPLIRKSFLDSSDVGSLPISVSCEARGGILGSAPDVSAAQGRREIDLAVIGASRCLWNDTWS